MNNLIDPMFYSVSDNKGPILAAAFAISELRRKVALGLDLVMLIEGEEEAGSRGFEDVVTQHKVSEAWIFR
jgi:di- and tripeptidase